MSHVYFISCETSDLIKIGWARSVKARLAELQTGCPFQLKVVASFEGGRTVEMRIHDAMGDHRRGGEWFEADATGGFLSRCGEVGLEVAIEEQVFARKTRSEATAARVQRLRAELPAALDAAGMGGGKRRVAAADFLNRAHELGPEFIQHWARRLFDMDATVLPLSSARRAA